MILLHFSLIRALEVIYDYGARLGAILDGGVLLGISSQP